MNLLIIFTVIENKLFYKYSRYSEISCFSLVENTYFSNQIYNFKFVVMGFFLGGGVNFFFFESQIYNLWVGKSPMNSSTVLFVPSFISHQKHQFYFCSKIPSIFISFFFWPSHSQSFFLLLMHSQIPECTVFPESLPPSTPHHDFCFQSIRLLFFLSSIPIYSQTLTWPA